MNDLDYFRKNIDDFKVKLDRRGGKFDISRLVKLDHDLRKTRSKYESIRAERNALSKQVASAKAEGKNIDEIIRTVQGLKSMLEVYEDNIQGLTKQFQDIWTALPNLPEDSVPEGSNEEDNPCRQTVGNPRVFSFPVKDHVALGEQTVDKGLDFVTAANLSGSRFVVLNGAIARLHRVLADFMIDFNVSKGFLETEPPVLVKEKSMFQSGQLPKFADEAFETTDGLWLIPTAEVAMVNYHQNSILNETDFPIRYVARTNCFRREAGAAGQDTRGMIRQHQFSKVELVSIVRQEDSDKELLYMRSCGQGILEALNLPYRVIELCAGDLGPCAQKTYDIEVWVPSQAKYREISSCSNTGSYQARRMQLRCRSKHGAGTVLCHTLNASALAVGRTLVALMENYQNEDGSISIPEVLQSAMECDRIGVKPIARKA